MEDTLSQIDYLGRMELNPFTANVRYLSSAQESIQADLKEKRSDRSRGSQQAGTTLELATLSAEQKEARDEEIRSALSLLVKAGYPVKEEDLPKLLPPDNFAEELEVAAQVRAYLQVKVS